MSGPLLGLPAAVADIQDKLGRVQTAGGWAGAVFDGCWLEDGKVKLETIFTVEQEKSNTTAAIQTTVGIGQQLDSTFTQNINYIESVSLYINGKTGNPGALRMSLYDKTEEELIKTVVLTNDKIPTSSYAEFVFNVKVTPGNVLQIRVDDNEQGDSNNYYNLSYQSSDVQPNAHRIKTQDKWGSVTNETNEDLKYIIKYNMASIAGTVTLDISPSSLYAWRNTYFKTKKPENTDIVCTVKDASDNVLIPNIADGGDLSSIDPTQYETLRLVWTLTRDSVEDESPVVYEPFWSWLGVDKKSIANKEVEQYFSFVYLTTTRTTLISVNNKGGRACAFISGFFSSGSPFTGTLYLTIDGVEYTFSKNGSGLVLVKSDLSGTIDQASISAGFEGIALILAIQMAQPIYFKNSFKAEAKCSSNGGNAMVCVEVDA